MGWLRAGRPWTAMATTLPPTPAQAEASSAEPADLRTALQRILDGHNAAARDQVREWLSQPENTPRPDLPMDEHREKVLAWTKDLAERGATTIGFPTEY